MPSPRVEMRRIYVCIDVFFFVNLFSFQMWRKQNDEEEDDVFEAADLHRFKLTYHQAKSPA